MPAWLWVAVVMTFAMVVLGCWADRDVYGTANAMTRLGGLALLAVLLTGVGLSAAGSIAKERQQQTITDLLMVPRPLRELLSAKWYASLQRGFGVGCGIVALLIFGVVSGGISIAAVPLLILAIAGYAAFATSLGLYLSVRCRTVMRASNVWMLSMIFVLGATYLLDLALMPNEKGRNHHEIRYVWDLVLHPVYSWQQLVFRIKTFDYDDTDWKWGFSGEPAHREWGQLPRDELGDLAAALGGVALYAFLAWILWRAALRRFRREKAG